MTDDTSASTTLLSQSLEAFQSLTIGGRTIVISVLDDLAIGEATDFGADYSQDEMCLYAESMTLSGTFKLKCGIISTQLLDTTGAAQLSTAGAAGASPPGANQDSSQPGQLGGPGGDGGDLYLYLGSALGDGPGFSIDASGGDGGAGQTGLLVAPGGTGGDGGAGGRVTFLAGPLSQSWIASLTDVGALTTVAAQQAAISSLLASAPTGVLLTDAWQNVVALLGPAVDPAATEMDVFRSIEKAALALEGISDQYQDNTERVIDDRGGSYGVYGSGEPDGKDGSPGKPGSLTTLLFGAPADLAAMEFQPCFMIHPSQCARLLNQIVLMYLVLDPVENPQGVGDIITLLTRLQARTQLFVDAASDSPLICFYNDNEQDYGAIGAVRQLIGLNGQATALLSQMKSGQDLFGFDQSTVPLVSFSVYKSLLDQLIANFSTLEDAYNSYFNALASSAATQEQIDAVRAQQQQIISTASSQIDDLGDLAVQTATIIDNYQVILPPLRDALEEQLEALSDEIKSHFDVNVQTFLAAMTSLAFAPESKFMMLLQATTLLYDGMSQVTNIQGVPVRKDYIISQLDAVEASVESINEGFEQLQNGALKPDDPAAGKLIAEESAFVAFMSQFEDTFSSGVQDAVDAFNAYVAAITQRNNQILTYNSTLLLIARNQAAIADANARNQTLDTQVLATLSPELPDLVSYVSNIYYAARNQVLQTLDQTSRAYRFWALSDRNLLSEAFGSTPPPEIDAGVLASAQNVILEASQQALESFGTGASVFPARGEGIVFTMSETDIRNMKTLKQILFRPTTVRRETTRNQSPFAGMANIRISEVRVWLDGAATSDGKLQVKITQAGQEEITSPGDLVYSFAHAPISKTFIYDLLDQRIEQRATFGVSQTATSEPELYAAIGPFAAWQIQVDPGANDQLDLSGLTAIRIEFRGTDYAFQ